MIKKAIEDLLYLFYPNVCSTCDNTLFKSEVLICTSCRHSLPFLYISDYQKNEVKSSFYGKVPIDKAVSFLKYAKQNKAQKLIYELKYRKKEEIGTLIGNWFGNELNQSNEFNDIDYIIPVPLDAKKLKKRGYNQLTKFGISLAKQLNTQCLTDVLIKKDISSSQTKKDRFERFSNPSTTFFLKDAKQLTNKNILLIDDVITTGGTLEACCNELLKAKGITISIATIAFTEKD